MRISTFEIAFPEHTAAGPIAYWLDWLSNRGAAIEALPGHIYRISCGRSKQLAAVGWAIYHADLATLCRVVAVSDEAEDRASAYTESPL